MFNVNPPVDSSIRLFIVTYEIKNLGALVWVAQTLLTYFAWRFYLNSQQRVRLGYRKTISTGNFIKSQSRFFNDLKAISTEDFEKEHKDKFLREVNNFATQRDVDLPNDFTCIIHPEKLEYSSHQLGLHYQASIKGMNIPG